MLVAFVVNVDWFFISHRLPIALAALNKGYKVSVIVGNTGRVEELRNYGFDVYEVPVDRSGMGVLGLLRMLLTYWNLMHLIKPDVVHLVTIKPVLLGGIAARLARVHGVVAAISGLGYVFISHGLLGGIRRYLVGLVYRLALGHKNIKVIFQNHEDKQKLMYLTGLSDEKVVYIPGSGVDLNEYVVTPMSNNILTFTMAARLLVSKGVREFVDAAKILRLRGISACFQLVGEPDFGNPASIKLEELEKWKKDGYVKLLGFRNDMAQVIGESHVVVLPSFYGEGLPKILIEAAACGRVVITTDMPGCRDAIDPGVTGILVPPRDSLALADAMQELIENPEKIITMGEAARQRAEKIFDVRQVVQTHLDIYQELMDL